MMRKAAGLVLAVFFLMGAAAPGFAWSAGTHVYVAEQSLGNSPHRYLAVQARYGSMAPDMCETMAMWDPAQATVLRDLTHPSGYDYVLAHTGWSLALKAFAAGWVTHNEVWGADYYAHLANPVPPPDAPGYIVQKESVLSEVPESMRHDYVESAVDLLVKRDLCPNLGWKVTGAAMLRDWRVPRLLCAAYSPPARAQDLVAAEGAFRSVTAAYGYALKLSSPRDKRAVAAELAILAYVRTGQAISLAQSLAYLEHAMGVCEPDYEAALDATIEAITSH